MRAPRAWALATMNRASPTWCAPDAATYTLNGMPLSGWACTAAAPCAATWAATAACIRAVVSGSGRMTPRAASRYPATPPVTLPAAAATASRGPAFGAATHKAARASSGSSGQHRASPNAQVPTTSSAGQEVANRAMRARNREPATSGRSAEAGPRESRPSGAAPSGAVASAATRVRASAVTHATTSEATAAGATPAPPDSTATRSAASAGTGIPTRTVTALRRRRDPVPDAGSSARVPVMPTGTRGTPAKAASRAAPCRNSPMLPSRDRVPSG